MFPPSRLVNQRTVLIGLIILFNLVLASWSYHVNGQPAVTLPDVIGEDSLSLEANIPVAELVAQSDLIVRGRIIETESSWNSDQTAITTRSTLEATYFLAGSSAEPITIYTDGGFVDGEIGMKSSNSPIFQVDEEVLLFLSAANIQGQLDGYNVTKGELGKYIAVGMYMTNSILRTTKQTEELYDLISGELSALSQPNQLPSDWPEYESDAPPVVYDGYDGQDFVYKNRKWGGTCPEVKFKVNVNTAQAGGENGTAADFLNAIVSASNTWNAVGTSDFLLTYDGTTNATETGFNGTNEILFAHEGTDSPTGLARFWFTADFVIVEADIWFNDDYNWDATGSPKFTEVDLESVALHEFGHWLALGHDDASTAVMFPTLTMGTTKRELHQNEVDGISFIYPRPEDSNCVQADLPTRTPTSTPTVAPTATATPTPVPVETSSLEANFESGAPGSYFTIFGGNYEPSEVMTLEINDEPITTLQVDQQGGFVAIINSSGAAPGTYTISTKPGQNIAYAQSSGSNEQFLFAGLSGQSGVAPDTRHSLNPAAGLQTSVSILIGEDLELRPKEVPIRTSGLSVVEFNIEPTVGGVYLPIIQN